MDWRRHMGIESVPSNPFATVPDNPTTGGRSGGLADRINSIRRSLATIVEADSSTVADVVAAEVAANSTTIGSSTAPDQNTGGQNLSLFDESEWNVPTPGRLSREHSRRSDTCPWPPSREHSRRDDIVTDDVFVLSVNDITSLQPDFSMRGTHPQLWRNLRTFRDQIRAERDQRNALPPTTETREQRLRRQEREMSEAIQTRTRAFNARRASSTVLYDHRLNEFLGTTSQFNDLVQPGPSESSQDSRSSSPTRPSRTR